MNWGRKRSGTNRSEGKPALNKQPRAQQRELVGDRASLAGRGKSRTPQRLVTGGSRRSSDLLAAGSFPGRREERRGSGSLLPAGQATLSEAAAAALPGTRPSPRRSQANGAGPRDSVVLCSRSPANSTSRPKRRQPCSLQRPMFQEQREFPLERHCQLTAHVRKRANPLKETRICPGLLAPSARQGEAGKMQGERGTGWKVQGL